MVQQKLCADLNLTKQLTMTELPITAASYIHVWSINNREKGDLKSRPLWTAHIIRNADPPISSNGLRRAITSHRIIPQLKTSHFSE